MQKMKICFVVIDHPPVIGGGESLVYNLANVLASFGHDIYIITSMHPGLPEEEKKDKIKILRFIGLSEFCMTSNNLNFVLPKILRTIKQIKPDIIHAFSIMPLFISEILKKAVNSKLFFTNCNTPRSSDLLPGFMTAVIHDELSALVLTNFILGSNLIDAHIAISKIFFDQGIKFGILKNKSVTIYGGINIKKFIPFSRKTKKMLRKKYNIGEKKHIILCPSRIVPRKRIEDLILAARHLKKYGFSFLLTAISSDSCDHEYRLKILDLISQYKLKKYFILPKKPYSQEQMPEIFNLADLVVLPSSEEGLGLSILEALACKIPVIAVDTIGVNEIIKNNYNGILIDVKKPKQISQAILKIVKTLKLSRKLSNNGRKTVEKRFDSDINYKKIESLYREELNNKNEICPNY